MIPDDEKHFTIHTDIEVSPQFFGWVCDLGKAVRILAPAEVVEEMGNYVKEIPCSSIHHFSNKRRVCS